MRWIVLLEAFLIMHAPFCLAKSELTSSQPIVNVQQEMFSELNFIDQVFRVMYAPAEWKREYCGWDPQEQYNKVHSAISNDQLTTVEFRNLLRNYFQSTCDYHVSILFASTEQSRLPFQIKTAEKRVFISYIDPKASHLQGLGVGDELLFFDDQPAFEVLQEICKKMKGGGFTASDQSFAAIAFSFRTARRGDKVPQGDAKITVRHKTSGRISNYIVPWDYKKEKINPFFQPKAWAFDGSIKDYIKKHPLANKVSLLPEVDCFKYDTFLAENEEDGPPGLGTKKSFVPDLGEVIWQYEGKFLHAYLYKSPAGNNIGYIRIPDFYTGVEDSPGVVDEFSFLIKAFENSSDALVIDEVHNPGGYVHFLLEVAKMLTNKPLIMPKERCAVSPLSSLWAVQLLDLIEILEGDEETPDNEKEFFQHLKNYCYFLIDQWNKGLMLSETDYFFSMPQLEPNPEAHYTKPIVMLIDELSISCGDFLPAIMADNNAVTLFGANTSGAGGTVESTVIPNRSGIESISYTTSILFRKNGDPLENLGVAPDVPYKITAKDLQTNYSGYVRKLNKTVDGLIKQNKAD